MAKGYIAKNCKKHSFVFDLQQNATYEDHSLGFGMTLSLPFVFVKAVEREGTGDHHFLVFPVSKKQQNSFLIFSQSTGQAWRWAYPGDGTSGVVWEQDFDPEDETKSQIFKIKEIASDRDLAIQFLSGDGNVCECAPAENDFSDALFVRNSSKAAASACNIFVPGFGENLPVLGIGDRGSLDTPSPELKKPAMPPAQKFFATRVVRLPFFLINDDEKNLAWKAQHSPWYYLRRQVKFVTSGDWFIDNPTGTVRKGKYKIKTGWSKTESNTFTKTLRITASAGGSLFGVDLGGEISTEMGYTSETVLTKTQAVEQEKELVCDKYKALVIWQQESTFTLFRGDKTEVGRWVRNDGGESFRYYDYDVKELESKKAASKPNENTATQPGKSSKTK